MSMKTNLAEQEAGMDINFDEFESQIDKEIDSLFVPFDHDPEPGDKAPAVVAQEPRPAEGEAKVEIEAEAEVEVKVSAQLEGTTAAVESVETSLVHPVPQPFEQSPAPEPEGLVLSEDPPEESSGEGIVFAMEEEPVPVVSQSSADEELSSLLESFHTAYLSLDWEFSISNMTELSRSLDRLEPYCQKLSETHSLYKMMKAVLNRLKTHPDSVSQQITEFIRDAQELLKLLLLSQSGPGYLDKEQLKSLIGRFQAIRAKALEEQNKNRQREQAQPAVATQEPEEPAPVEPKEGVELSHLHFEQALRGLKSESKRLRQLEEILAKTSALAPITSRLNKIRSSLNQHIKTMEEKEHEWSNRLEWLKNLEDNLKSHLPADSQETPVETAPVAGTIEETTKPVPSSDAGDVPERFQEQVCLFDVEGRRLAVLASDLVKIERVSTKKLDKILLRGYATLLDFKPFFKSVKTGLLGAWGTLPSETLKTYRFIPLPAGLPNAPSALAAEVILVSNGEHCGMLCAQSSRVDVRRETITKQSKEKGILGSIECESGGSIEVLNVDWLLKNLHLEGVS